MTTLPNASDLGGSPTQGTFKTKIQDLRNFIADLLGTDSANKPAARAALGLSATGEALATAASKAAARQAIDLPGALSAAVWGQRPAVDQAGSLLALVGPDTGFRNAVINGDFRLWQRGTSFNNPNGAYTADRWIGFCGAGNTVVYSRQAFAPGTIAGEPRYFLRMEKTAGAAAAPEVHQRIEGVRSFADRKITVSVRAKADSARSITIGPTQVFGTGGSPSSSVPVAGQSQLLTTTWAWYSKTFTIPSIAGKTLGTNEDDHLDIAVTWGTNANGSIDIAEIQVEEGEAATPFERRPLPIEWLIASRYYWKSYDTDVAPGTATGSNGAEAGISGLNSAVHAVRHSIAFPVPMRKVPTFTLYDTAGASGNWTGAASASVVQSGKRNATVEAATATSTDSRVAGHLVADAEL